MTELKASEVVRIHIWVRGRVQGVGFRAFAQQAGVELALTGWVRNVGYDRVETVAEGPREKLERFEEAIKIGPRAGNVDEAKVEWETAQGEYKNFSVKYNI
ncbi:MAG: acylphosphatase [Anaerolineales bacterium]|jgi:acylphosphatase